MTFPSNNSVLSICATEFRCDYRPSRSGPVDRLDEAVRRLWEGLKPDAVLYLNIADIDALESRILKSCWFGLELPRHLFPFSTQSLRRLLLFRGLAESRIPCAIENPMRSIPWRPARNVFRLSSRLPFHGWTAFTGRGASIAAVFRKKVAG